MSDDSSLATLILAAGESKRLGQRKQLVAFRGAPLLVHALRAAVKVSDLPPVVVLGDQPEKLRALAEAEGAQVVENPDWRCGQASSLRAGVEALPDCAAVLVTLCDQALVDADALMRLVSAWRSAPQRIVAAGYGGACGAPAVFPARYRAHLSALRGDRGARDLLKREAVSVIALPEAAFDLDTAADLQRLRVLERPG